jgi:hypothetical protein
MFLLLFCRESAKLQLNENIQRKNQIQETLHKRSSIQVLRLKLNLNIAYTPIYRLKQEIKKYYSGSFVNVLSAVQINVNDSRINSKCYRGRSGCMVIGFTTIYAICALHQ